MTSLAYKDFEEVKAALEVAIHPHPLTKTEKMKFRLLCGKNDPSPDASVAEPFLNFINSYIDTEEKFKTLNRWETGNVVGNRHLTSIMREVLTKCCDLETNKDELQGYIVSRPAIS